MMTKRNVIVFPTILEVEENEGNLFNVTPSSSRPTTVNSPLPGTVSGSGSGPGSIKASNIWNSPRTPKSAANNVSFGSFDVVDETPVVGEILSYDTNEYSTTTTPFSSKPSTANPNSKPITASSSKPNTANKRNPFRTSKPSTTQSEQSDGHPSDNGMDVTPPGFVQVWMKSMLVIQSRI